jgi:hypothetical protein
MGWKIMLKEQTRSMLSTKLTDIKPYLVIFFVYYLLVSFTGYGNDDDIFRVLASGQDLFLNHVYHPSRFQGYLIPEIVIGITSLIGGHYLSNFVSVVLAIAVLYLFHYFISKVFDREISLILTLIVGFNPYFVIAATSSLDYIYGLFFLLLGILLLYKKRYLAATLAFALALSSRMANALLVGFVFGYFLVINYPVDKKEFWKIFATGFFALLLTLALYIPVYIASDHTFRFFSYYIQGYGWTGYVTRFIYKNIAFIGLISTLFLYGVIAYNLFKKRIQFKRSVLLFFVVAAIIVEQLKFLKIPIQLSFLLPTFMLMVTLYPYLLKTKLALYVMLCLTLFYSVVNIDFLKFTYVLDKGATDGTTLVANGAEIGLFINPGIIIQDIKDREPSRITYFKEMKLPRTKEVTN